MGSKLEILKDIGKATGRALAVGGIGAFFGSIFGGIDSINDSMNEMDNSPRRAIDMLTQGVSSGATTGFLIGAGASIAHSSIKSILHRGRLKNLLNKITPLEKTIKYKSNIAKDLSEGNIMMSNLYNEIKSNNKKLSSLTSKLSSINKDYNKFSGKTLVALGMGATVGAGMFGYTGYDKYGNSPVTSNIGRVAGLATAGLALTALGGGSAIKAIGRGIIRGTKRLAKSKFGKSIWKSIKNDATRIKEQMGPMFGIDTNGLKNFSLSGASGSGLATLGLLSTLGASAIASTNDYETMGYGTALGINMGATMTGAALGAGLLSKGGFAAWGVLGGAMVGLAAARGAIGGFKDATGISNIEQNIEQSMANVPGGAIGAMGTGAVSIPRAMNQMPYIHMLKGSSLKQRGIPANHLSASGDLALALSVNRHGGNPSIGRSY